MLSGLGEKIFHKDSFQNDPSRYAPILFIIPILYLVGYFYYINYYGPFFATRIDPEYPYLLNGLNCAQLLFGQIGHVHHPGTPFQIFTGVIIRFTHLLFGKGEILEDVFQRPEFYLHACSHALAYILAMILWWVGYWGRKLSGYFGMLVMQLSPFLSAVVFLMVASRYTPDRFVVCLLLLSCGLMIRELHSTQKADNWSFAVWAGVLSGVALCSKISCMPVLLIPFLAAGKHKWIFALLTGAVFFFFLLPVASRVDDFFGFTTELAKHDGLYGSGQPQVLNWERVWTNLQRIVSFNTGFVLVWAASLAASIWSLVKREIARVDLWLIAFVVSSIFCSFLVAKHFKNYYLAPILIYIGFAILLLKKSFEERNVTLGNSQLWWILPALTLFLAVKKHRRDQAVDGDRVLSIKEQVATFDALNLSEHQLLIDPGWQPAPYNEKGVAFGISYIRHHNRYEEIIEQEFPYVVTYEGSDRPTKKLRVIEFDQGEMYRPNKHLYFYSRDAKRTTEVLDDLQHKSKAHQLRLEVDTIAKFDRATILDITFQKE